MVKLVTWGDSHWGVVQLQTSSRLPGWHSRPDCSHKDGENKTWILSLFFLHILSHIVLLKALFKLFDGELVVCVANQGRAKPCKARLTLKKWVAIYFLWLIMNMSHANYPPLQPPTSPFTSTIASNILWQSHITYHMWELSAFKWKL